MQREYMMVMIVRKRVYAGLKMPSKNTHWVGLLLNREQGTGLFFSNSSC